jgi:hypothetical protein
MIGSTAFVMSVIIFCGSVWLLLALIMGGRLAYMITASCTLGFLIIMAAAWSYGDPLGPVGVLPSWQEGAISRQGEQPDAGPGGYPDRDPWHAPDTEDERELERATELQSAAQDYLTRELDAESVDTFESGGDATVDVESVRIAQQGGREFGGVTLVAVEPAEGEEQVEFTPTVVIMEFDPGAPNRPARLTLAGTILLFAAHLVGLNRMERKARRAAEAAADGPPPA